MSRDLLGDAIPATPPMTAPLPYIAWQMLAPGQTDPDYWAARTEREAREAFHDAYHVEAQECQEVTPALDTDFRGPDGPYHQSLRKWLAETQPNGPCFICGGDYD